MSGQPTPGPWTQRGILIAAFGEGGGVVCELSELRGSSWVEHKPLALGSPDWDEQMANAHLIAAAPDLLWALENAVAQMRSFRDLEWPRDRMVLFITNALTDFERIVAQATGEGQV